MVDPLVCAAGHSNQHDGKMHDSEKQNYYVNFFFYYERNHIKTITFFIQSDFTWKHSFDISYQVGQLEKNVTKFTLIKVF